MKTGLYIMTTEPKSQSYITADGQSVDLLMWGALSDEKSDLQFPVFAGHRQRSLSQV
jgi:hypothetical protein